MFEVAFPGKGGDDGLALSIGELITAAGGHIHPGPGLRVEFSCNAISLRYCNLCKF